jgi:hypothetical protein
VLAYERVQRQCAGDPVGRETMLVLEPPDCLRGQRAISPIGRAGREPSPRQPPLQGTDRRGPAGLEIPSAAHQRASSQRLVGLGTDDSVDNKTISLLEALHGLHRQRAVAPIDGAR